MVVGVLLGAMDDRDASRVHSLLSRNTLVATLKVVIIFILNGLRFLSTVDDLR